MQVGGISSSGEFALHMFMHCVMSQCLSFDKLIRLFPPYTHIYTSIWSIPALPNRMQNDQLFYNPILHVHVYHLSTFRLWPIAVRLSLFIWIHSMSTIFHFHIYMANCYFFWFKRGFMKIVKGGRWIRGYLIVNSVWNFMFPFLLL